MKAAVITRAGGPDVLEILDVPRPLPRAGEILIQVRSSALNRADIMQRQGRYPAPPGAPANIPGLEFAGEVAEVGPGVRRWKPGDRVFGLVGGGGQAEFLVTREDAIAGIPERLSWEEAGAVPEAFITAHDALVTLARMQRGDYVLVHAIGSGVGMAAVQLVKAFGGICLGTARQTDKIARAKEYGLTQGAVLTDDLTPLAGYVQHWTDHHGVDVALDLVGGPYLPATIDCCAPLARVILVGLMAGRAASLNLGTILNRRITVRGTMMRSREPLEKAATTDAFARDVLPLLERGEVHPVIDSVFPLERIAEAHARMESNASVGKIVITV